MRGAVSVSMTMARRSVCPFWHSCSIAIGITIIATVPGIASVIVGAAIAVRLGRRHVPPDARQLCAGQQDRVVISVGMCVQGPGRVASRGHASRARAASRGHASQARISAASRGSVQVRARAASNVHAKMRTIVATSGCSKGRDQNVARHRNSAMPFAKIVSIRSRKALRWQEGQTTGSGVCCR
jgi:hypothetical protein